jgi:hypothetical protein
MKEVLNWMKNYKDYADVLKLPMWLLVAKWKVHNLLYDLKYQKLRTDYLDIEPTMDWKHRIGYALLSLFYWGV